MIKVLRPLPLLTLSLTLSNWTDEIKFGPSNKDMKKIQVYLRDLQMLNSTNL